jgi:tRNA threonylcarbamoyladenosine biosynthesis protein TsaB
LNVLAIETSSSRGSVALLDDDRVVAGCTLGEGSRHGRELLPCIDVVVGGDPLRVDLVAVSAGPGSYTGMRIGITFARTFCIETRAPLVGVSSLDVIAANVPRGTPLCVVVDARLRQVYAAFYEADGSKSAGDLVADAESVAEQIAARPTRIVGDALRRYRGTFESAGEVLADEALWAPRAENCGRLGLATFREMGGQDPRSLLPRYLRRPTAKTVAQRA